MFLNGFPGRTGPGLPGPHQTYFDFAVFERPKYIPGSGPPLAPVTPMPIHDKDGVILDLIQLDDMHRYVVGYEDQPHLRVSVKLENILNWVSPRTLEEWQFARTVEQEKLMEEAAMPRIKAREEKRKAKIEKLGNASRVQTPSKTQPKKRKRATFAEPLVHMKETRIIPGMGLMPTAPSSGPGRRRRSVEESVFTSPKASLQTQTSLSSPNKQRGLAEIVDFESEDDDTQLALELQLNAGFAAHSMGEALQNSRSASTSQEPYDSDHQPVASISNPRAPPSRLRESSRPTSSSSTSGNESRRKRHSSLLGGTSAIAATSSRGARTMYEELERKNKAKFIKPGQTISQTYSYQAPKPQKEATPAPLDDDEEYEVDRILDDSVRPTKDGTMVLHYLIKWVGEWDDSWEPAEGVGKGAIKEYNRQKRKKQRKQEQRKIHTKERTRDLGDAVLGYSDDALALYSGNGGGKERMAASPGIYDDNDGDMQMMERPGRGDGSDEELFVNESQRFPNERGDRPKGKAVPRVSRGEVIDDDENESDAF
jgi:hypothetical protein